MLSWVEQSNTEKVSTVAGIHTAIWVYLTLTNVKYEVKEIFLPSYNILQGIEFVLIGLCIGLVANFSAVCGILKLHGYCSNRVNQNRSLS
ncbi:MAG: hypothetical protein ACI8Z1_003479 [Candidatus Azotimanducaceae bacterium]|jgi:hypothetical protein